MVAAGASHRGHRTLMPTRRSALIMVPAEVPLPVVTCRVVVTYVSRSCHRGVTEVLSGDPTTPASRRQAWQSESDAHGRARLRGRMGRVLAVLARGGLLHEAGARPMVTRVAYQGRDRGHRRRLGLPRSL